MITAHLVATGYTFAEAERLVGNHLPKILANLCHMEEQDDKDRIKVEQFHAEFNR